MLYFLIFLKIDEAGAGVLFDLKECITILERLDPYNQ
jgi:hypothetical protein